MFVDAILELEDSEKTDIIIKDKVAVDVLKNGVISRLALPVCQLFCGNLDGLDATMLTRGLQKSAVDRLDCQRDCLSLRLDSERGHLGL